MLYKDIILYPTDYPRKRTVWGTSQPILNPFPKLLHKIFPMVILFRARRCWHGKHFSHSHLPHNVCVSLSFVLRIPMKLFLAMPLPLLFYFLFFRFIYVEVYQGGSVIAIFGVCGVGIQTFIIRYIVRFALRKTSQNNLHIKKTCALINVSIHIYNKF